MKQLKVGLEIGLESSSANGGQESTIQKYYYTQKSTIRLGWHCILHTSSIRVVMESSIPGEICSRRILKLATNGAIKKSYQYHSNIQKSCIDFAKEKGCGVKIKLVTPILILNSKQQYSVSFAATKLFTKQAKFKEMFIILSPDVKVVPFVASLIFVSDPFSLAKSIQLFQMFV